MSAIERLAEWKAYVAGHDPSALDAMIDENAVFHSPVVHTPQRGKPLVVAYLTAAYHVLGGEGFRYTREYLSVNGCVLEFEHSLDGIHINGIDMIEWNDAGRIVDFKVMVRPLKAVNLLHEKMGEMLARSGKAA